MNTALALEAAGLAVRNDRPLEAVLAFLASRRSANELSAPAGEVFKGIAGVMDQLLTRVIEARTATEFNTLFSDAYPKYFTLTTALSRIAQTIVPDEVMDRLTRESICELESDFRQKALAAFGATARDQSMFTIWTLRKINDLLARIRENKVDETRQAEEKEFCWQFNVHSTRAHFSLDCLNVALRNSRPIYPEVMPELIDGLRAMVNAYTWARRGAALRDPDNTLFSSSVEPLIEDEEEQALLAASMQDMARMGED
jgi:hypothetical protein